MDFELFYWPQMVTITCWFSVWLEHLLDCMGGCFGCCTKPIPVTAVDEPSKGLRIRGQIVRKQSNEFWSSSPCDVEISTFQSQQSISSISTANWTPNGGTASMHPDFVNHGLILWNQSRLQWIGTGKSADKTPQSQHPRSGWNPTYDSLLSTRQQFPQPIPLSEMVESLVEIWEHEGLYD